MYLNKLVYFLNPWDNAHFCLIFRDNALLLVLPKCLIFFGPGCDRCFVGNLNSGQ